MADILLNRLDTDFNHLGETAEGRFDPQNAPMSSGWIAGFQS
jgi:hypothetical protein